MPSLSAILQSCNSAGDPQTAARLEAAGLDRRSIDRHVALEYRTSPPIPQRGPSFHVTSTPA
jgi:hypothetical protein